MVVEHDQFLIDPFGALFVVQNEELIKFVQKKEVFRYSNSRLGQLSTIDVSNPLATMCFYEDYQVIQLLDRTLNPLTKINLVDWGYTNVTAVCLSGNNELWIYDASAMQLMLMAKDRETPLRSFPFNLAIEDDFKMKKMLVKDGVLYCLSSTGNLYTLSLVGEQLRVLIGNEQIVNFQFTDSRLLIQNKKGQVFYYKSTLELIQLKLPVTHTPTTSWSLNGTSYISGDGAIIKFFGKG